MIKVKQQDYSNTPFQRAKKSRLRQVQYVGEEEENVFDVRGCPCTGCVLGVYYLPLVTNTLQAAPCRVFFSSPPLYAESFYKLF